MLNDDMHKENGRIVTKTGACRFCGQLKNVEVPEDWDNEKLDELVAESCNCDDANLSKVVDAAQEQLAAIRVLKKQGILENLPVKLQQAAAAREENPEAALAELAAMMDPPITKPAMNHRLKKLVQLSREVTV